jgi:cell division protein ZapA
MAHVNVTIGGRPYRMACDDGQEAHLEDLAATVDQRIAQMKGSFGEIGDQRLTVMAAISILDEAGDLRRQVEKLEADVAALTAAKDGAENAGESWAQSLAEALESSAARIERLARDLGPAR